MGDFWGGRPDLISTENQVYRFEVLRDMPYRLSVGLRQSDAPRGKRPRLEILTRTEYLDQMLAALGEVSVQLDADELRAAIERVDGDL